MRQSLSSGLGFEVRGELNRGPDRSVTGPVAINQTGRNLLALQIFEHGPDPVQLRLKLRSVSRVSARSGDMGRRDGGSDRCTCPKQVDRGSSRPLPMGLEAGGDRPGKPAPAGFVLSRWNLHARALPISLDARADGSPGVDFAGRNMVG